MNKAIILLILIFPFFVLAQTPDTTYSYIESCNAMDAGIDIIGSYINQNGFDSVHIEITTLLPTSSTSIFIYACDSVEVIGNWVYNNSSFYDTIFGGATNGCDSIIFYEIEISHSMTDTVLIAECDSVNVMGDWYYLSTTLFFTIPGENGCDSTIVYDIDILEEVSGHVYSSSMQYLINSKVLLIEFNPNDSSLIVVDSVFTDSLGYYYFNNISDNYYLKAIPDSALYPFDIPTYFSNSVLFQNADNVYCGLLNDFTITAGLNPGGNGFISGLIGNGAGKASEIGLLLENESIFLVNENNEVVKYTVSNSDGYFEFNNIPCARYKLWVDDIKLVNNDLSSVLIDLTSTCDQDSIEIVVDNKQVKLVDTDTRTVNRTQQYTKVYPNPANNSIIIDNTNNESYTSISIIDITGKVVKKYNPTNMQLDISSINKGIYFLQLKFKTELSVVKLFIE